MPQLNAKVAQVLDDYRIALNAGEDNGVREGDEVTLWRAVEVKDPDTGEALGTVYLDALHLRITQVQPKMSVARVAGETNFLLNLTGPRKRIEAAVGGQHGDAVRVSVGDPVSIKIAYPLGAHPDGGSGT